MAIETKFRIVSSDDHIDMPHLPPDLFEKRLPADLRERGPRVIDREQGPVWVCDGKELGPHGGRPGGMSALERRATMEVDGRIRPTDPELRQKDMDADGIEAQMVYLTVGRWPIEDKALYTNVLRALNDWGYEFQTSMNPQRVFPIGVLPVHDPEAALEETIRLGKMGYKGVEFGVHNCVKPMWHQVWDPIWAAAAEAGMPVSFHVSSGNVITNTAGMDPEEAANAKARGATAAYFAVAPVQVDEALTSIIFCGALDRNPNLKIMLAESDFSWQPYIIDCADQHVEGDGMLKPEVVGGPPLRMKPSEYFLRQVFSGFEEDQIGIQMIQANIFPGLENQVMFAVDYPHPRSTWPRSQQRLEQMLAGVPEDIQQKLTRDNCRRLYNLP